MLTGQFTDKNLGGLVDSFGAAGMRVTLEAGPDGQFKIPGLEGAQSNISADSTTQVNGVTLT